jgi:preprotein translocase subunit SecG
MYSALIIVHVLVAASLIGLVLIQHGKGADAGAAFGSGASQTVFGSRGSGSFLTRATAVLAASFFATSLVLASMASQRVERRSVTEEVTPPVNVPAQPAPTSTLPSSDVPAAPGTAAGQDVPAELEPQLGVSPLDAPVPPMDGLSPDVATPPADTGQQFPQGSPVEVVPAPETGLPAAGGASSEQPPAAQPAPESPAQESK